MRIAPYWLMLLSIVLILAACEPEAAPPEATQAQTAAPTVEASHTPNPTATRIPVVEATPFFGRTIQSGRSSAAIRVIHTSPDTPPLDIQLAGSNLVASLGYGLSSGLITVVPGEYALTAVNRGESRPLAETPVTLKAGVTTDVIIIPDNEGMRIVVYDGPQQAIDSGISVTRVIHALKGIEGVSVRLNDMPAEELTFGSATSLHEFPQGSLPIVFSAAENELITNTLRVRELTHYTLILAGVPDRPQLLVFETPVFGRYSLRVVNMSADAREVDVYFDNALVASNLGYKSITDRAVYANAAAALTVHAASADLAVSTPILSGQMLSPRAGTTVTLALYGAAGDMRAMWIEEDVSPVPVDYSRVTFANIFAGSQTVRIGVNSTELQDVPAFNYGRVSAPTLLSGTGVRLFVRDMTNRNGDVVEMRENVIFPTGQSIIYFITGEDSETPVIFGEAVEIDQSQVVNPLETPAGTFSLRYVNAIASQPIIDIAQEGVSSVIALPYGAASDISTITTDNFQLTASMSGSGGATLIDLRIGFNEPGNYIIYLYGTPDNGFQALPIQFETFRPDPSIGKVRLVNLTNDSYSNFSLAAVVVPPLPANFTPTPTIIPTATSEFSSAIDSPRLPPGVNAIIRQIQARQASNAVGVPADALVYIVNQSQEVVATLPDVPFEANTLTDIVFYQYPTSDKPQIIIFPVVYSTQ